MAARTLLSLEEFEQLRNDENCHELDQGELVTTPPAQPRHGSVQANVALILGTFVNQKNLGEVVVEVGFLLTQDPPTVRAPDVAFIRAGRPPAAGTYDEGAPDLAIEIISPSDTAADLTHKIHQYLAAGGQAVWVLYPKDKLVHVFESGGVVRILQADQISDAPRILPGFSIQVEALFA